MSTFTMTVILGVLMILGGISLALMPITTFMSSGFVIIIMFFAWGIYGVIRGISNKRYNKEFFFSILSLILGIVGLAVPGVAVATANSVLLYLAAGWFVIHGVLSIMDAVEDKQKDSTLIMILRIILGVLEILTGIFGFIQPAWLAPYLGILIGFSFIEGGLSTIIKGMALAPGGNSMTVLFTVMGVLTIMGGVSMLATPVLNFLSAGYCIIMLFFIYGVIGVVRGFMEKSFGKAFWFSILSLVLGIIGLVSPDAVAMSANYLLLYLAAGWFILHGVLAIINAVKCREETGTGFMIVGIILGVLELIMAVYSIAHPAVLVLSLGLLAAFYFIESGAHMIFLGSAYARAVALARGEV